MATTNKLLYGIIIVLALVCIAVFFYSMDLDSRMNTMSSANQEQSKQIENLSIQLSNMIAQNSDQIDQIEKLTEKVSEIEANNTDLLEQTDSLNAEKKDLEDKNKDSQTRIDTPEGKNTQVNCRDTDGGKDYYTTGVVYVSGPYGNGSYNDFCTGDTLTEWYCDEGSEKNEPYQCPNGCAAGHCKNST